MRCARSRRLFRWLRCFTSLSIALHQLFMARSDTCSDISDPSNHHITAGGTGRSRNERKTELNSAPGGKHFVSNGGVESAQRCRTASLRWLRRAAAADGVSLPVVQLTPNATPHPLPSTFQTHNHSRTRTDTSRTSHIRVNFRDRKSVV